MQCHISSDHLKCQNTSLHPVVSIKEENVVLASGPAIMASPVQDGLPLESSQSRSLSLTGSTTSIGRISLVSQVDETREKSVSRISESLPHVRKRHLTHEQEVEDLEDEVKRLKMTNWTISRLTERNEIFMNRRLSLRNSLNKQRSGDWSWKKRRTLFSLTCPNLLRNLRSFRKPKP